MESQLSSQSSNHDTVSACKSWYSVCLYFVIERVGHIKLYVNNIDHKYSPVLNGEKSIIHGGKACSNYAEEFSPWKS